MTDLVFESAFKGGNPRSLGRSAEIVQCVLDRPSVQWHLAQILAELPLAGVDPRRAIAILMRIRDQLERS